MHQLDFDSVFAALNDGTRPFPWLRELFARFISDHPNNIPEACDIPTGLGKTSVVAVWLIALANCPERMPRRLVYVVNRRTVVDQTTNEVEKLRAKLGPAGLIDPLSRLCALPLKADDAPLAISTLRGQFADNREWSADPARPAVIVGTVDMIGSRLLFSGYGVGFKAKPLHAGFLGQDVLLVHDEAHLEPAFQDLLVAIQREQKRCQDFRTFRVLALTATARGKQHANNDNTFELTDAERNVPNEIPDPPTEPVHVVWRRLKARKAIQFVPVDDEKEVAERIAKLALADKFKLSGRAILIFVRTVEDVEKIVARLNKENQQVQQLTGTLRGLERDRMADPRRIGACPIFARFLRQPKADAPEEERWKIDPMPGTVYLVCTSAGEVGVNISADHLICDLATFESMAQRFGRVNRFGDRDDTEIHVVHPTEFDERDQLTPSRKKTLALLRELPHVPSGSEEPTVERHDGSPAALAKLDATARQDAFAPLSTILPVTDILFDSWAMTTIRDKLPGRPPVEPYLHGIAEWQPAESHVVWREEVSIITRELSDRYNPEDLLDDYPLKPHELLRDRSDRVFKHLSAIAQREPEKPVWLLDDLGNIEILTMTELAKKENKNRINYRTVLLSPDAGGLKNGLLNGGAERDKHGAYDVSEDWFADDQRAVRRRIRVWDDDPEFETKAEGMRLVRTVDIRPDAEEDETGAPRGRFWYWYARPRDADDDLSRSATEPIKWDHHTRDVTANVERIGAALKLPEELQKALILAAKLHDLGKRRIVWQRSIGNPNPTDWHAKSGRDPVSGRLWKPIDVGPYRHEFGSLLDLLDERHPLYADVREMSDEMRDLVLHLIAAHHGRARPHFPVDEAFDPEHPQREADRLAHEVPRRFARLQRKYGRWGLAYLESLLRAADYAASASPSPSGG